MPTGYTYDIPKGQSFEDFILGCARAFGALVMMRDEPAGTPIPHEFAPDDYYTKAVREAEIAVESMRQRTDAEWREAHVRYMDETRAANALRCEEKEAQRGAYARMLEKAQQWTPPTPEHSGLKSFMIEQIQSSVKFDCGSLYQAPVEEDFEAWRAHEFLNAKQELERDRKNLDDQKRRAAERTAWVRALRDSI